MCKKKKQGTKFSPHNSLNPYVIIVVVIVVQVGHDSRAAQSRL